MGKLRDYYGEFERRAVSCRHCGWSGEGADMTFGDAFRDGIERHCPACGERYGLAQYAVIVADHAPESRLARS